jgi:hypothetical protein
MNKHIGKSLLALGAVVGARQLAKAIQHMDASDVLHRVGLKRRHSAAAHTASSIGLLALGALAGAGVALLFAPSSRPVLRSRISHRIEDARQRISDRMERMHEDRALENAANS